MNFNPKLFLILLLTISEIFASVNDKCTGRNGICITTGTCSSYGGKTYSGYCPYDPSNVLCCDDITCTLMMEEKGLVYILVNAVVVQSMENVQEALISNAAFQAAEVALWILHMVYHAMEAVVLA